MSGRKESFSETLLRVLKIDRGDFEVNRARGERKRRGRLLGEVLVMERGEEKVRHP
jgi:hypothetical protein